MTDDDPLAATVAATAEAYAETAASDGPGRATGGPGLVPGMVVAERYRIERFIAAGGMGEVYEAHDTALDQRIALKTIRPDVAAHGPAVERFLREIALARKVTHPNVCRIFELGYLASPDELPFLTMELLHGEPLHARIRRGPMTPAEALPIVTQVIAGLEAAHKAGVVHRDFKSPNVVLVGDRAVITDFGLARTTDGADGVTSSGAGFVGTPAYMAPEQVHGDPVGAPADVYALGVVMFEMMTGKLPFTGDTPLAAASRRLTAPPPAPTSIVPSLAPAWNDAILHCLARAPEDRPTLDELRAELTPAPRARGRLGVALASAAVLVIGGALALWAFSRAGGTKAPATAAEAVTIDAAVVTSVVPPTGTPIARATLHLLRQETGKARVIAEQAIAHTADDHAMRLVLVRTLIELGLYRDASAHLGALASASLTGTDALLFTAYQAEMQGQGDAAADALQRAYAATPTADLGVQLFLAHVANRRIASAEAALRQLQQAGPPDGAPLLLDHLEVRLRSERQDFRGVVELGTKTAGLAAAQGLPGVEGRTLYFVTSAQVFLGELDAAVTAGQHAREVLAAIDDRYYLGEVLNVLALAHFHRGELAAAGKVYEEGLALQQLTGITSMNLTLNYMMIRFHLGHHAEVKAWLDQAMPAVQPAMRPSVQLIAAWERIHAGDPDLATQLLDAAGPALAAADLRIRSVVGMLHGERQLLAGDLADARQRFEQAIEDASAIDYRPVVTELRVALAEVAVVDGRPAEAAALARQAMADADAMELASARVRARLVLARAEGSPDVLAEAGRLGAALEDPRWRWAAAIAVAAAARDTEALAAIERDATAAGMPGTAAAAKRATGSPPTE